MAAAVVDGFQSYKKYKQWSIKIVTPSRKIKASPILLAWWDFVQRPTANLEIGKQDREYGLRIYTLTSWLYVSQYKLCERSLLFTELLVYIINNTY